MKIRLLLSSALLLSGCSGQPDPRQLVQGLGGDQAVECAAALRQREDALPALLEGTRSPNPRLRSQCARLLGMLRDVRVIDGLKPLLCDPQPEVRSQAARALVSLVETPELVGWLRGTELDRNGRLSLTRALLRDPSELVEPQWVDWLCERSPDPEWRLQLYEAMLEFYAPEFGKARKEQSLRDDVLAARARVAASCRADALNTSTKEALRVPAIQVYALYGGPPTLPELQAMVHSSRPGSELFLWSLVACGMSKNPAAVTYLASFLQSGSENQRVATLAGLSYVSGKPGAVEVIVPSLHDPSWVVRRYAIDALGHSRGPQAEQALSAAASSDPDPDLRARAAAAFRSLRNHRRRKAREERAGAQHERPTP